MKQMDLNLQMDGVKEFERIFNSLLKKSNYKLDQFIQGDSLIITDDIADEFANKIKQFINQGPEFYKLVSEKDVFWEKFKELEHYEENEKFINWLRRYFERKIKPFKDAAFIRAMEKEQFEDMTQYCFTNLILNNIGRDRIDDVCNLNDIDIFKKVMLTYIDMIVIRNFPKERVFKKMKEMFDLQEWMTDLWWNLIQENEDRLWRIVMMWRCSKIEDKLDIILEMLEKKDILY